mmetsp:Transcript_3290/g.7927  ORF Transcript_3290/g.7927 Transcript_3290/m.7927 type:complete len:82 (+) Transcript_3290:480-725(+)
MDLGDFDFSDVLKNFTGFTAYLFHENPYVGDNTTKLWDGYTTGEGGPSHWNPGMPQTRRGSQNTNTPSPSTTRTHSALPRF